MSSQEAEIKKILEQIAKPNIAVIGKTGVGKSSLLNAVFKIDTAARTGAGKPITKFYQKYAPVDSPIVVFDSPGYEIGKDKNTLFDSTISFLAEQNKQPIKDHIHLIWYTINSSAARIEDFEIEIIKKLNDDLIPVIIVLTQCDRASESEISEIKKVIKSYSFLKVYDVIEVSASPLIRDSKKICQPFGLDTLIQQTINHLPDIYSVAVIAAQLVDIRAKRKIAWEYISKSATGCFTVGAIPIPLTAPKAAVGSLSLLFGQITFLYGLNRTAIVLGITGITAGGLITLLTSAVIDSFSFIPGISVISASMGALYTTVSGLAYATACEELHETELKDDVVKDDIEQNLNRIFKQKFNNYMNKIQIKNVNDLLTIGKRWVNREI